MSKEGARKQQGTSKQGGRFIRLNKRTKQKDRREAGFSVSCLAPF
jgi:hypothetical protein